MAVRARVGAFTQAGGDLRLGAFSRLQEKVEEKQSDADFEELNLIRGFAFKKNEAPEDRLDDYAEDGFPPGDEPVQLLSDQEANTPAQDIYEVVHVRVPIRKRPSKDSHVIGVASKGEQLKVYEWDPQRQWRKIHFRLRGGWGSLVAAWVMVRHQELGSLLKPADGAEEDEQPANVQNQQAPGVAVPPPPKKDDKTLKPMGVEDVEKAATELEEKLQARQKRKEERQARQELDALKGIKHQDSDSEEEALDDKLVNATLDDLEQAIEHGGLQYQVVHEPFVAIRNAPNAKADIVGSANFKTFIDTFGWDEKKQWRKIYCRLGGPGGRCVAAWMKTSHPELGALLEPAAG